MRKRGRGDRKWMNEKKTEKEAERKSFMVNESKDSLTVFLSLFLWFHLHLFSCDSFSFLFFSCLSFPSCLTTSSIIVRITVSILFCLFLCLSLSLMSVVYVSSWVNSFSAPLSFFYSFLFVLISSCVSWAHFMWCQSVCLWVHLCFLSSNFPVFC